MGDETDWLALEPVKIDPSADELMSLAKSAATKVGDQASRRDRLKQTAMADFKGLFADLFQSNQDTAVRDGRKLEAALNGIATQVQFLKDEAIKENKRRAEAKAWAEAQAKDDGGFLGDVAHGVKDVGHAIGVADDPDVPKPAGPQPAKAAPDVAKFPKSGPRELPSSGSGGTRETSARPADLRDFAKATHGDADELDGLASKLKGKFADFQANWEYGSVTAGSTVNGLVDYVDANREDAKWVNRVATAFEAAGASGAITTVSNQTLFASLGSVAAVRHGLTIKPPQAFGMKPTSGYSDDPVNACTGNFVEPETDLTFPGGCAALELTRMYNSFDREGGAFGVGWSSWTEVKLVLTDEGGEFTLPDGRMVAFPRQGDGWARAQDEALWLQHDPAADEYRVTDNDGATWRFTSGGTPLSHDRGEGTMVSLVHRDGRLVRMEHERGRSVILEWDGDRVVAAVSSDGRRMAYDYDDEGRLHEVTGSLGTRTYRWNDAGFIEAVIDADGVVEVQNTYDEQGRVISQLSPHGRTSRYAYLPGNVTDVSDPDGTRSNTWIHDRRGRLLAIVDTEGNRQSTAYDNAGDPVMVTEADGSVTVREFDERGHLNRQVTPSGADLQFEYDELDRLVTTVTEEGALTTCRYEGTERNPSVIVDPEGGETRLEWSGGLLSKLVDPTGVTLRFGYNEHGDLVSTTNAVGDVARLEYDDAGRVVAAITPRGNRTEYVYDDAGLMVERRDPDGAVWRFEYSASGRRTAVVDPTGSRITIEYGASGDESALIDPLGRTVRRRLDDLGNLASVELPDGSAWCYAFDGLSRLTGMTSPDGGTWRTTYDQAGEIASVTDPTGVAVAATTDRAAGTVTAAGPDGPVRNRFDPLGRHLSTEAPDGSVAMATYDRCGRAVELLDGEGSLTRIERDAAGRPIAITDPAGEVTRIEYDACGRRSAVIDPAGGRTTWSYNADSLPDRVTLPTGETGWVRYDAVGRVTSSFIPGVGTSRFNYDAAGRLVQAKDSQSGLRRFSYDAAGQVVSATNGNGGVTRYEYDANGRCVAITDPLGNVTRREFNALGRCIAETDPLGRTRRAGYDDAGRQVWQEDATGARAEWIYDETGNLVETRVNGEIVSRISRDPRNRTVTVADHTRGSDQVVELVEETNRRGQIVRRSRGDDSIRWGYDVAGRRTSMRLPDGKQTSYGYGAGGRLAFVDHPLLGRASFEYDASGRVTSATAGDAIQSWSYQDGFVVAHAVTDADGSRQTRISHDEDGRVTSIESGGETTSFEYDAACQLIGSMTGSSRARWSYDQAGRLVAESVDEVAREFAYDAASQLMRETGPDGTTTHAYDAAGQRVETRFADGRVRSLEWTPSGWLKTIVEQAGAETTRTQLHVDAVGELTSIDGTAVWWDSAMPYAPTLAQVGATPVVPVGPVTGIGQDWTAAGWRNGRAQSTSPWDAALAGSGAPGMPAGVGIGGAGELTLDGLEWLGARVYDPTTRGFLSVDPLDPVTGAGWAGNPYSYAGNDPLHALDPTGLKPVTAAELNAARQPWTVKAWNATTDWVDKNTDYLIGAGLAAVGVGVMLIPVPGAQVVGMGFISAGADTIMQRAAAGKDGQINWKQVAISGAVGAAGAGAGSALKVANAGWKIRAATQGGIGFVGGGANEVAGGAKIGSRQMWAGAFGGGLTSGFGGAAQKWGDGASTWVTGRLGGIADDAAQPISKRVLADLTQTPAKAVSKVGTDMGVDFTGGAAGQTVDQIIRPGDQDAGDIANKGLKKVAAGRVNAGVKKIDGAFNKPGSHRLEVDAAGNKIATPSVVDGAGKPIGSIVDIFM